MYLFCLDEGGSQDVLGGQWSWEKPGWMFLFPLVSEMPSTLGIIYISETLWHVWGKKFFCFHRYLRCQIPVE